MNTIHIIMDTLKVSWLGAYGSSWVKTPNIDKFADKSVVFTKAYCSSFPCMPARRDFMTGKCEFPFRGWGPLEEDDVTLPAMLKESGKVTGLVTDHFHLFRQGSGNYHFDYDAWHFIRGLCDDHYYTDRSDKLDIDYGCRPERISEKIREYYFKYKHFEMKEKKDWPAFRTFHTAYDWVRRNHDHEKGFHLQIDSFPPHEPFDPPPGYAEAYNPGYTGEKIVSPAYRPTEENYTDSELENIRAQYAGTITYVDECFGQFMDQIEELGSLDNTAIIISSDHGTYTGDHGWTGKLGTYMYDCVSHVPLILYHPGMSSGRCEGLASNCDVVPTILDICGVEPKEKLHGKSLLPMLRDRDVRQRDYVHSGFFGMMHVINDGRYAFHMTPDHSMKHYWYGVHDSLFVPAGKLGPIEIDEDGNVCRQVDPGWEKEFELPTALFDLKEDPEQTRNIACDRPDIVKQFTLEFERFCCYEVEAPKGYAERYREGFSIVMNVPQKQQEVSK